MTPYVLSSMFFIFSLFINGIFSLPICEPSLQTTLNISQCSPLHVPSVREIENNFWKGTRGLVPGVEYWTDAMLEFTPWIQFSGCLETSEPQNFLERSGIRLLGEHPITDCVTYVKNSTFYLWGSRCIDQESVGNVTGGYCFGVPFNLTSFHLTGYQNCICRYDIADLPTEPGLQNCKRISFTFGESGINTLTTALHNVNCDSKLPSLCVGRENDRKKNDIKQFKVFDEDVYNISTAKQVCSLVRFDMVSTARMQYMANDFQNNFINNSKSYWSAIFRENRFIFCGNRSLYDYNSSYCITVMSDHNQTVVWNVRSCSPLEISYNTSCTDSNDTSDIISKPNQNQYFWCLFVLVVPAIVIVVCIIRRQHTEKPSGYSYYRSKHIHYTEQRVRGIEEERTDADYDRTVGTRSAHNDAGHTIRTRSAHNDACHTIGTRSAHNDADHTIGTRLNLNDTASTSQRRDTHIVHDQHEEPQYMSMAKPEESIYISIHLKYPINR